MTLSGTRKMMNRTEKDNLIGLARECDIHEYDREQAFTLWQFGGGIQVALGFLEEKFNRAGYRAPTMYDLIDEDLDYNKWMADNAY